MSGKTKLNRRSRRQIAVHSAPAGSPVLTTPRPVMQCAKLTNDPAMKRNKRLALGSHLTEIIDISLLSRCTIADATLVHLIHDMTIYNNQLRRTKKGRGERRTILPTSYENTKITLNETQPGQWRDLTERDQLLCAAYALTTECSRYDLCPITINLSWDAITRAVDSHNSQGKSVSTYLANRLSERIKEHLGRKVDYWLALEVDSPDDHSIYTHAGRLHVHAVFMIDEANEKAKLYTAIHALNGEVDIQFKKHAVRISPQAHRMNLLGWVGYSAKTSAGTRLHIGCAWLSMSADVRASAQRVFDTVIRPGLLAGRKEWRNALPRNLKRPVTRASVMLGADRLFALDKLLAVWAYKVRLRRVLKKIRVSEGEALSVASSESSLAA